MPTDPSCPFCSPERGRVFHSGNLVSGLWDPRPLTPGHALLVTRRHVASWFDATRDEQADLFESIAIARRAIEEAHGVVEGYSIGIEDGAAAGQSVSHLHLHVIPRRNSEHATATLRRGVDGLHALQVDRVGEAATSYTQATFAFDRPALFGSPEKPLLPELITGLDRAKRADLAVAFVLQSGVAQLEEALRGFLDRGGHLRLLTGDYRDVTDPDALVRLLDLVDYCRLERSSDTPDAQHPAGRVELRVFEAGGGLSFHPKAYVFHFTERPLPFGLDLGGVAYVGSSNLTKTALSGGIEWNYSLLCAADRGGFQGIAIAFEDLFAHPRTQPLTVDWIEAYRRRRKAPIASAAATSTAPPPETPEPPPPAHEIQEEALMALAATRTEGNEAGLVVMATGLGKTWLAAFDVQQARAQRTLFVAHRDEILRQAQRTFRRILPEANLGVFTGQEKSPDADVLFASVQSLARSQNLESFRAWHFDYIVIDEFHHAAASTYRRLIQHFEPRFLLGLTATPERTDGGNLLALCGENLVYRCDLFDAIRRRPDRLVPFHYYGVPDEVDYANIPWRNHRFDPEELTAHVATAARANNALEQWRKHGGKRTLGFCCSTRHADFMAEHFRRAGVRAAALHSGETSAPRATTLGQLRQGSLECIFAVDILNEGVDLPELDTVLMLRPTESRIVFLQQLGRGLRASEGKTHLSVVDYIGNHRSFKLKPQALFGLPPGDEPIRQVLRALADGSAAELELPPGCEVTYELEARRLLESQLRRAASMEGLVEWYAQFEERTGARPRAVEAFHEGRNPRSARTAHGSWLRFVAAQGGLNDAERELVLSVQMAAAFLEELETMRASTSADLLVILAMLRVDALPGAVELGEIVEAFAELARRSSRIRAELAVDLSDKAALRDKIVRRSLAMWSKGRGRAAAQAARLRVEGGEVATEFVVPSGQRAGFHALAHELAEWRLAHYLASIGTTLDGAEVELRCKVLRAGNKPILKIPSRSPDPGIPTGDVEVSVRGRSYVARFAKEYVNVVHERDATENVLPDLARRWFGDAAGAPGTLHFVAFRRDRGVWKLRALAPGEASKPVAVWASVGTRQIPRDAEGVPLDATFEIDRASDEVAIVYHARGGTQGTKASLNADYASGLLAVLSRLKNLGVRLVDMRLDSKRVQQQPIEQRSLKLRGDRAYPIDLRHEDDLDELRRAISHAQGSNPTRRIRLVLDGDRPELDRLFES